MLVIRLVRTGRRNQPKFRMVVTEDSAKLQGKVTSVVGHYQPTHPDKPLVINKEEIQEWISKGAQPSNTVAKLLNKEGFDLKVHVNAPAKPKKEPKEEAPKAAPAAAPAAEEGEAVLDAEEVESVEAVSAEEGAAEETSTEEETDIPAPADEETPVEEVVEETPADITEEPTPEEAKAEAEVPETE